MAAKDAGRSPIPEGFGRDTVAWRPSADHDPIQVAALHLQHLLIATARRTWPHVRPGSTFTSRALATVLGTPNSVRPSEKRLAGKQSLQLDDIVRLALYLGDDVLATLPQRASELFPEPYRPLLAGWEPGHAVMPTFRQVGPGGHDWARAVSQLAGFLDAEAHAGRDHLLTTGAVTYGLVGALNDCGTDPSSIELHQQQPPDDAVCTLAIGPDTDTTLVNLAYVPDRSGQARPTVQRISDVLYATADTNADHRVLVIVTGHAGTRQLRTHLPETVRSPLNIPFTLTFQELTRRPVPGQVPNDLDVSILGRAQHHLHGTVLAALITKRR